MKKDKYSNMAENARKIAKPIKVKHLKKAVKKIQAELSIALPKWNIEVKFNKKDCSIDLNYDLVIEK